MITDVLMTPRLGRRSGFRWITLFFALPAMVVSVVGVYLGAVLPWAWRPDRDGSQEAMWVAWPFDRWFGPVIDQSLLELATLGGYDEALENWSVLALAVAAVMTLLMVAGFFRRRFGLMAVRAACILFYLAGLVAAHRIWSLSGFLESPPDWLAPIGYFGERSTFIPRFWWWYELAWPFFVPIPLVVLLHVLTYRASAVHLYTGSEVVPRIGDRIVEDARVHGEDPDWRKSWLASAGGMFFFVVILPWILAWIGCSDRYYVPEGSGDPVVQLVQVVKPKKVEKEIFIINPKSAISFYVPKLEDSEIEEQVEEMTEMEYTPVTDAMMGATGQGGGKTGGWPEGMGRHPVRFIRLRDFGPGWEDGMDASTRADMNFLEEFEQITGFKVASKSEAKTVRQLSNFDKGFAPPFVYMTGDGSIRMSRKDTERLREYLLTGGLLFADAGHPRFHRAFTSFIQRQVFPDNRLIPIADDDPIFKMPFGFPNGAPPLWHHGGRKAMGVKARVNGRERWVVFYHPGDLNDAWKSGHSGLDRKTAKGAYHMGVNIIYYAFTHYLEDTRKYRK